jgi:lipopolysaccharide export system protein LptA
VNFSVTSLRAQRSNPWLVNWIAASGFALLAMTILAVSAFAQSGPNLDSDAPIEIASDNLEVLQDQNKAIFSGKVVAKQGTTTMTSSAMTVFYAGSGEGGNGGQGITRIEASGKVVFVTPQETAQGDTAIYNVATKTIDLVGNVVLTREENILKGSALNYNMTTKRSVLSAGNTGRVRGLFVPGKN